MFRQPNQRALRASRVSVLWVALTLPVAGMAGADHDHGKHKHDGDNRGYFRHLSTFDVMAGNGSSVAEILDVSKNGKQLV